MLWSPLESYRVKERERSAEKAHLNLYILSLTTTRSSENSQIALETKGVHAC